MKEITGTLKMLGSSLATSNQIGKSFIKYNSIEIGDQVLQKIRTARTLGDYIERGLNQQQVTLYLIGKLIIAIKFSDGKIYYWKRSYTLPILCLITLPLYGFGLILALISLGELKQIFSYQPQFAAQGGVALQS